MSLVKCMRQACDISLTEGDSSWLKIYIYTQTYLNFSEAHDPSSVVLGSLATAWLRNADCIRKEPLPMHQLIQIEDIKYK
ncbi:hypothetical protein CFP56_034905 [Quercus suber]|uniref:Uncharacterized protein n=1 Tax=Quercus suber TaxID=58331 RepID=A0AAW0JB71_QUESU